MLQLQEHDSRNRCWALGENAQEEEPAGKKGQERLICNDRKEPWAGFHCLPSKSYLYTQEQPYLFSKY